MSDSVPLAGQSQSYEQKEVNLKAEKIGMKQSESNSSSASPNGKRSRDPEDEIYVDNLHSHKRYLSEIMASSLNGLTVGDHPIGDNLIESPARSETNNFYSRDEMSWQYSPMSEDSDDSRFCETTSNACSSQPESLPTSPVSPYRYQRPLSAFSHNPPTSSYSSPSSTTITGAAGSQTRQRGSDSEGRFPSSPSDICHSADLRRAALLRSVQMRSQPPGSSSFDLPNMEADDRPCLYMKSVVEERDGQIEECSAMGEAETEFGEERTPGEVKEKTKEDDLGG